MDLCHAIEHPDAFQAAFHRLRALSADEVLLCNTVWAGDLRLPAADAGLHMWQFHDWCSQAS